MCFLLCREKGETWEKQSKEREEAVEKGPWGREMGNSGKTGEIRMERQIFPGIA